MASETGQAQPAVPEVNIMKEQEAKLREKYPGIRGAGSSSFLQKRLSKGQKYFDSGDYNMAKARGAMPPPSSVKVPTAAPKGIPTAVSPPKVIEPPVMTDATGEEIPTPENVHRKPSLNQSKLVTETLS